ncbi:MAG TPA: Ig-like domain-containing protein [Candidatus Eisenbacteria bacterium]|nr:Ig-like domain-containing protein [Candidatus Eisenbacteria bacterium]
MRRFIVMAVFFAGALAAGCSEEPTSPAASQSPTLVSVSPRDGAGGVSLDAPVTLGFSAPVDRDLVQNELYLISEWAISDSVCPDSATMWHGDMEHCMDDAQVMRHLDRHHATHGGFSWNPSGTVCTFRPAEGMIQATRYMIHIGPEVARMGSGSTTGMMDGNGHHHGAGGDMALHFTTMGTP